MFEDFLKSAVDKSGAPIYRARISQIISSEGKSLAVDFGDMLKYNDDLANRVLLEPDATLASFKTAAFETMRSENALYADRVKRDLVVRIRGLTDMVPLRKVDTSYLDKMLGVAGMVVRTSELRPLVVQAAWVCPSGHLTYQEQDDLALKRPAKCELCGEARNFELDRKNSLFIDFQIVRIQELPEELPPGHLPQFFDVNLEGDIVNTARPGDRVVLTGVLRAVPDYSVGQVRMRLFKSQIDCNYVEVRGKEAEQIQITKQDEMMIKSVAKASDAYEKLIGSMAPAILGHDPEKEAILLLLVGGTSTFLPDGTKLRGDVNILLVGDPGCLVADERVVLGNGAIIKIGQLGREHLQPLHVQVLTGHGGGKRAWAERFHVYRGQPIVEIVTESGKSIKGTPNHPLLQVRNEGGKLLKEWCRLDGFKEGDRVAVVTGFPCTIKEYLETKFAPIKRPKYGPKFAGKLPGTMTPRLAAFCGYVLGDGWVNKDGYRFGFVVAEPEIDILPQLLSMVEELFGLKPKVSRRIRSDRRVPMNYVHISNEDIAANLGFLREKRVPDLVLQSGNEVVESFLRWLYEADGTVFAKGRGSNAIGLKAKGIELLRDVQMLLLRFGIHSRIVGNALLIRRGEDIARFSKYIGFASEEKNLVLKSLTALVRKTGRVHRQRSERIVRIIRHPPADVYDIEVPGEHRFIANGIVSHNTAKSELLKFAAQVAPRGLFASGRGTTAAGLSAAVIREKNVFMLEAGVVVLADQGIACVTEDTEVYTGQSLTKIGDVWRANGGEVFVTKTGREAKKSLTPVNVYDRRLRADLAGSAYSIMRRWHSGDVVKINFGSGLSLKVTPEHLLMRTTNVKNLWVRADELKPGDELRSPVRTFGPAATLRMAPTDAYVVGCVYGDGWMGPSSITISQSKLNSDVVDAVLRRAPSTFTRYDKGDRERQVGRYVLVSRMFQLYTTNREFLRKCQFLIRSPSTDSVLMLDDDALWGFLAGVFDTDGDLDHVNGQVVAARLYPTKDPHELAVLLHALRRLGVYARVHGKHSSVPIVQMTGGDISRFLRGIGGFSVKLRREREEVVIHHKGRRSVERGVENVLSVERLPYSGYVYDLSVGKYHNYEASLVYVHNCIDEFDKMRPEDRSALHEQMEQQTVTVAKGGIYASLNARTAILAAMNPVLGKYNPFQNLTDNIGDLPIPLLTRFDLIFVIKDQPSMGEDEKLATHILSVHTKKTYTKAPPVEFDLLKKYISYAKKGTPTLTKEATDRLKDYYLELRRSGGEEGQLPPTPRTLESLIRLATARAKLLLKDQVTEEDALGAVALMNRMVQDVLTDATTKKTDFGIQLGKPAGETRNLRRAMEIFRSLEGPDKKPVERKAFKEELLKARFADEDAEKMIKAMFREGLIYESKPGFFRRVNA